ncbi:FecCD family ABC transporter permease [Nocardiopsis ansamitocini]|uniref:Iron ABC transporter permease n=1 Tax=Nocardiopsis ansamitocini TaxID=1670832 RepID=A0A9W6P5K8_9ACTN|nr:iron chelate uptake ABC transporter family permease subunit [Nocardiopsis ansamitocini]GLU47561.1 iron ABC transporter permease [Nocardiopsis ansamitocini]
MSLERPLTVSPDRADADDATVARSALDQRTSAQATTHLLRAGGLLLALGVLALFVLLSIAVGAKSIPPGTVWNALLHYDGSYDHVVVRELRLPRTVLGIAVGAALGLAGALMQALVRNPLADPGILGVNAGATTAVVIAIFVFGLTSMDAYIWFAFAGAGLTAVLVYFLGSRGRTGATPVRLALAGTAVAAVLVGITSAIIITNEFVFDQIRFWQVGALVGRDLDVLVKVAPFLIGGMFLALFLGPALNAVSLGEDMAAALGANINRTRIGTALSVVLLCGAATAAAGPIAFVGLAVPHVARLVTGPDQRWVLPYSAVLAAALLVGADTLGRVVLPNGELEVGIITALIGAPIFIALVRRKRMAQL